MNETSIHRNEAKEARLARTHQLFFELLQVAIGTRSELSVIPTEKEWKGLFLLSGKHAVLGIAFIGLRKLPDAQKPPHALKKQWLVNVTKIQSRNEEMNVKCREVCESFVQDGYGCCVLKGQSNLEYYRDMGLARHSGDIDLWAWPLKSNGNDRKDLISYAKQRLRDAGKDDHLEVYYHHADLPYRDDVQVEVHFTPSWAYNIFYNKRIQRWFDQIKRDGETVKLNEQGFYVSSAEFNIVYQLMHISRHLFTEGIGLRQLLDYYMVLSYSHSNNINIQPQVKLIEHFGMKKFCASVMYVLQQVFAMPDKYLFITPEEKEGQHLLDEILIAGNFGQFDMRYKRNKNNSHLRNLIRHHQQTNRFFWSYPAEAIFELPFRFCLYCWRKKNGYL